MVSSNLFKYEKRISCDPNGGIKWEMQPPVWILNVYLLLLLFPPLNTLV
jgi:hypothetical protein